MRAWVCRRRAARSGGGVLRATGGPERVRGVLPLAEGPEAPCRAPGGARKGHCFGHGRPLGACRPGPLPPLPHARQGGAGGPTRRRGGRRPGGSGGASPCRGAASRRRAGRPAERPRSGPGSWGPWSPPSGGLLMVPGCPVVHSGLVFAARVPAFFKPVFLVCSRARARTGRKANTGAGLRAIWRGCQLSLFSG